MYQLKENIDLSRDIKIANNVEIKSGKIIAKVGNDIVEYRNGVWYINNISQGDGHFVVQVEENEILVEEYFENNEL